MNILITDGSYLDHSIINIIFTIWNNMSSTAVHCSHAEFFCSLSEEIKGGRSTENDRATLLIALLVTMKHKHDPANPSGAKPWEQYRMVPPPHCSKNSPQFGKGCFSLPVFLHINLTTTKASNN